MSASRPKDRVTYIAIREIPPHIPKESFEANVRALADSFMALPVCKKNGLIYALIFQTPLSDASLRALGYPESGSHVLFIGECESHDHWAEILSDPEFIRIVTEGRDSGFAAVPAVFSLMSRQNSIRRRKRSTRSAFLPFSRLLHGFLSNNTF
ncbi:hypothetical protein B0H16DRAFT_344234 [Mycena metata]|uniref:Uncharacterized protein n=1 Tax=Mycena metata TaxID=1033252 RepID=A0AAD7MLI3_9AGAR|nr:hypothetical protein B0H16DRAFT_344234 [Mycena metata]